MNKRTVGLLAVVLVTCLPGCVDLNEDVVTGLTPGAYGSEGVFQALVNASYEPLRSFWAQERGFTLTEFGTDIYTKGADGSYKYVNDYTTQLNPTVDYITNTWNDFYRAINTINAALDQAPVVQMDSSVKVERMAEVRFLRALYYFYLVQMFGPLHITLHEVTAPTTEGHRYPIDSVYDGVIIPDLQYAEAHLPAVQQDYGRATKGAVDHLLAKVYLARLRVPDDSAGNESAADEVAKQQAGDFANAADYAQRVIKSGLYQLLPRFGDVFDLHNERNAEVIWSVQYTADPLTTGPGNTGHLYFLMEYDVLPGMLRDIANGRPFKRFRPTKFFLGLYDRTKDARYDAQFQRVWYANNAATIPKYANGAPKFQVGDTAVFVSTADSDTVRVTGPNPVPYRVYTPKTYSDRIFPSLNKFLDPFRLSVNETRGSRDFLLFRLAETNLIAAEALLRDGRPAEGLTYINAVRRRAAIPGHETEMDLTVDQLTLDEVLNERARELAGESMRWFDLVRTHKLVERVKLYNPDGRPNIKPFHALRPIPQTQIDRTTTPFPQNPGY